MNLTEPLKMYSLAIQRIEMYTANNQYDKSTSKDFGKLQYGFIYAIDTSLTSHKAYVMAGCKICRWFVFCTITFLSRVFYKPCCVIFTHVSVFHQIWASEFLNAMYNIK